GPARENTAIDPPASLTIESEEAEAILALAPLLLRSPRALKRYLNTYRMLKAEVSDRGDLEVVRFLLAVAIGRAGEGTELLAALASRPDATLGELAGALRAAGRTALTGRLGRRPDRGWRDWRCA